MFFTCLFIAFTGKIREIRLDENFFTGYRKTILEPNEVLVNILIPFTEKVTTLAQFLSSLVFQIRQDGQSITCST